MKITSKRQRLAKNGKLPVPPCRNRSQAVDAWLRQATGLSKGITTTAKVMKTTRSEN